MSINDQVAVIVGATGGLGRVVARKLADRGTRVGLVGSSQEKLTELERELVLSTDRRFSITADLNKPEAAQEILEIAISQFGRVDILLQFIGGWMGGIPLTKVASDDIAQMLNQHLWTTFHLTQVFTPHMVNNGWGRIIAISSPNVTETPANGGPYTIGKSAQEALMFTLAQEIEGSGVTANIVRVRTIDVKHQRDNNPSPKTSSWTTPEEIASAIFYLCSIDAGRINGALIPLYGNT